ncbi:hypothetical protein [Nocardia suismassiliense]|uniref:hypothetical protein n=1 Tax=Nocardia suismassiliense TaxID=2077092 RepID=UPI000D1E4386|nr:hypothetical protein [Nocardia suismassiliense]
MDFAPQRAVAVDTLAGSTAPDGIGIRADQLPPSTHGSNLRAVVSAAVGDALRIPVCAAAGDRCEICGAESRSSGRARRPACHEKWEFEFREGRPVQRLARLVALCTGCHEVQHAGYARVQRREHEVVRRLCTLNGWTAEQAHADLARADARCAALDAFSWDLDLSVLRGQLVLEEYAELMVPAEERARLGNSYFRLPASTTAVLASR